MNKPWQEFFSIELETVMNKLNHCMSSLET